MTAVARNTSLRVSIVVLVLSIGVAGACSGTATTNRGEAQSAGARSTASNPTVEAALDDNATAAPESTTSPEAMPTTAALPPDGASAAPATDPSVADPGVAPAPAPVADPALVDPAAGPSSTGDLASGDSGGQPPTAKLPDAGWIGFGLPQPGTGFKTFEADTSFDGKGKFVAITFDDGPSQYTPRILEILNFLSVKATFFMISKQASAHAALVQLMVAGGMRVGAHTRNHPHLPEVPADQQADQVLGSADVLDQVIGAPTVRCFRPPYGEFDQNVINLVGSRGLSTAMWSIDSRDWSKPGAATIVQTVLSQVRDRSVILLHDGGGDRTQTIEALPWIIQAVRNQGYQIVPIC